METLSRVRTCMKVLSAIGRARSLPVSPAAAAPSGVWRVACSSGAGGPGPGRRPLQPCACSPAGGAELHRRLLHAAATPPPVAQLRAGRRAGAGGEPLRPHLPQAAL